MSEVEIVTLNIPKLGRIKKGEIRNLISSIDDEQISKLSKIINDLNEERVNKAKAAAAKAAAQEAAMLKILEAVESAEVSPRAAAEFLSKYRKPKPDKGSEGAA